MLAFGSPLPHTIAAKQIAYVNPQPPDIANLIRVFMPQALFHNEATLILYAVVILFVIGASSRLIWKHGSVEFAPLFFYTISYSIAVFVVREKTGVFWSWWTAPLLAFMFIIAGLVLHHLFAASSNGAVVRAVKHTFVPLIVGLSILFAIVSVLYGPEINRDPWPNYEVAHWLQQHAQPSDAIMLESIGYIGFVTDMYIYDFIGLISPEVTRARAESGLSNRWFAKFLQAMKPTFVVLRKGEVASNEFLFGGYGDRIFAPEEQNWFASNYVEAYSCGEENEELAFRIFRRVKR